MNYRIEVARDSLEHEAIIRKHKLNNGGMLATLDYERGDYTAIAYTPDGKPVGAATVVLNLREHRFKHLALCYVKRNHRRSALGRQLIETLLRVTQIDRGAAYAYLGRVNTSGRFWEALGIYWAEENIDLCFTIEEMRTYNWGRHTTADEKQNAIKRELEYNADRLISQRNRTLQHTGVPQ